MMRYLLLLALSACSFPRATDRLECAFDSDCVAGRVCQNGFCVVGETDSGVDGPTDGPQFDCTVWTPAPQHFAPCDINEPTGALTLDQGLYTFDTGTGELTGPAGFTMPISETIASGMLISVDSLTIASGSSLRVIGPVPLIVAAWTTIDVTGDVDAGSRAREPGPGSNPTTECGLRAATPGQADGTGGGGAGGGGFRGRGGDGGDGDGGANGIGGALLATPPLLLGGCNGATGGAGDLPGGIGGAGGGAIQLTAKDAITIAGKINAGGAGGEPGQTTGDGGGGGGGGSGGMIGLEGATITLNASALLAANGGGGGEGGDSTAGARGTDATATATRAPGGAANPAGNGGLGSGGTGIGAIVSGGVGANDGGGGGGGGGGGAAGFISFKSATAATVGVATISPPPTVIP